jgi:hypothetical protein
MYFKDFDHSRIADPADRNDPVYVWVGQKLEYELTRLGPWQAPDQLCFRNF